jgi:hypothetical protein
MAAEQRLEVVRALAIDVAGLGQCRGVLLRFQRGHANEQHPMRQQAVGDVAHEGIFMLGRDMLDHIEGIGGIEFGGQRACEHIVHGDGERPPRRHAGFGVLDEDRIDVDRVEAGHLL